MNLSDLISRMTIEERAELRRMLEEPEPEAKTLGQVLRDNLWPSGTGDTPWDTVSAADRAHYEHVAAVVIAEYERRNPRKVPTVEEVAKAVGELCGYSIPWEKASEESRNYYRRAARAVFPLFGCEP